MNKIILKVPNEREGNNKVYKHNGDKTLMRNLICEFNDYLEKDSWGDFDFLEDDDHIMEVAPEHLIDYIWNDRITDKSARWFETRRRLLDDKQINHILEYLSRHLNTDEEALEAINRFEENISLINYEDINIKYTLVDCFIRNQDNQSDREKTKAYIMKKTNLLPDIEHYFRLTDEMIVNHIDKNKPRYI